MNKKKIQMSKEAEEALLGSIQKWVDIVWNGGVDKKADNCPLCQMREGILFCSCSICPVKKHTGRSHCEDTPYIKWHQHLFATGFNKIFDEISRELAEKELDFLISLYPGEIELVWEYEN